MSRAILFVSLLSLVSGCSTISSPIAKPSFPPIPPSLTDRLPEMTPLANPTCAALAAKLTEVTGWYYVCRQRHSGLSDVIENRSGR